MIQPEPHVDIAREFERRKPWVTKFVIDGREYGGYFDAVNDGRLSQFFEYFPHARTVLELGALEGGHSLGIASRTSVQRIVAIEGRRSNIEKARFVQKLLGTDKIEFVEANLQDLDPLASETFDAVFCSGLLYHLPEPWKLIARCAQISPNLFIWTQYAGEEEARKVVHGFRGKWYREGGLFDPLSGLSAESFWPTLGSLFGMLTRNGYKTIHLIENNLEHPHGPAVTLAATRV